MSTAVAVSAVLITLALVFYTLGVWAERIARLLKPWHVAVFWTGLGFDVAGTLAMHRLAKGPFSLRDSHTLTGQIALWLMLIHAAWATRVARRSISTVQEHRTRNPGVAHGAAVRGREQGSLLQNAPTAAAANPVAGL